MIKQADLMDIFWKDTAGPLENIFGLVEYGYMFLGGFIGKAIVMAASAMHVSLKDLGRYLDDMFNLKSLHDLVNISDDAPVQKSAYYNAGLISLSRSSMDRQTALELLFGDKRSSGRFLATLKTIAKKILTGGLFSFLTLKGIQTATDKTSGPVENKNTNNTTNSIDSSKLNLEKAIKDALAY